VSLLTQTVVNAIALFFLDALMDRVSVFVDTGPEAVLTSGSDFATRAVVYLVVGLLLALVNKIVKPFVKALALPLYILTLGGFALVVNGLMLLLVSKLSTLIGIGLSISGLGSAILASIVLSILTALVSIPFKKDKPE
jgi:putative membrane protein